MENKVPEKAKLLEKLKANGFNVPEFVYVSAKKFETKDFKALEAFLDVHRESFKVIARSAHPQESEYKGGTFDSLETYADIGGIIYARNRIINLAETAKHLSIRRQQIFNNAPPIDLQEMGVIVMPFVNGSSVMAKMIHNHWEFGYCRNRNQKVQTEPHITRVPHDRSLYQLSRAIQKRLGFKCEIEYIISTEGDIHVVQAKDISRIETLEEKLSERSVRLDGVRRIRKQRNYRERSVYVMDNKAFYIDVISLCEDLVQSEAAPETRVKNIVDRVAEYEADLESFALRHQRFAVLGFSIQDSGDLYQIANHYLDDFPDQQKALSKALHNNLYKIDIFLAEADTLIARDKFRVNLCSHDAYGIDTVRNPLWCTFWHADRHDAVVRDFKRLGFKTGDTVGIDIGADDRPVVYRH
ncbi:hypothetical protein [Desulfotignum balticum]|uniref:hypothetical protein n=1 Tax=Desulfotignum balticum TaxID=115781 RepID=UPI0004013383|nr:hypothetical protein [Desulfotignum balticum]